MQTKAGKAASSWVLCVALIVAMALMAAGCNGGTKEEAPSGTESQADGLSSDGTVLGEGDTVFFFTVTDQEGNETQFEIHTDKKTVGEALLAVDLIAGEESEYGLMVTTVNGITADYEKDGIYWAFYIDGAYAQTGVDATEIKEGEQYAFKIEKA